MVHCVMASSMKTACSVAADIKGPGLDGGPAWPPGLLEAFRWLDCLLEMAVGRAQAVFGPEAANDPYRGLYTMRDEVVRLLDREPGAPVFGDAQDDGAAFPESLTNAGPLKYLASAFGLSSFDIAVALIALAPELDLRYERLFGYLQDDVT